MKIYRSILPLTVISTLLVTTILSGCTGTRPNTLGKIRDTLSPCPDKPNCVSSLSKTKEHRIIPLAVENMNRIENVLKNTENSKIIISNKTYIYAEFTSTLMRFVDDVEFLKIPNMRGIQVRSASRLGYSDLGANRKRIEQIRSQLQNNELGEQK